MRDNILHTHLSVEPRWCIPEFNVNGVGRSHVNRGQVHDTLRAEPRADAVRRRDSTHVVDAREETVMRWRFLRTLRTFLILGKPGTEFLQLRVVGENDEDVVRLL